MFEQQATFEQEARRVIQWLKEGQALKADVLGTHEKVASMQAEAKDAESKSRQAIQQKAAENEMAIANKVVELVYKGEFDAAHLWDAFPELWQESPHLMSALAEMKGQEIRAAAAQCLACTACTACAACGACALCIVSGAVATAGISVTSAVGSTQSYGS